MWVKSGETVSEISSELSPISISGRVELRNLHSLSDQKKLLSISRTKHILVFNMSVWFWRTLSKCFKFVSKSVDLQLWSVYHGRQWFFSETQVTKTMLEKSLRKKDFPKYGRFLCTCEYVHTFSSEASTQARTLPPYNVQGMSNWGIGGNLIPATKEMVIANAYKYKYK